MPASAQELVEQHLLIEFRRSGLCTDIAACAIRGGDENVAIKMLQSQRSSSTIKAPSTICKHAPMIAAMHKADHISLFAWDANTLSLFHPLPQQLPKLGDAITITCWS